MKITGPIILAILANTALTLHGQDAAPPSVDLYSGQKQAAPATPVPESNPPGVPSLQQLDAVFKPPSLGKKADESRVHIEWRRLANRTTNDPTVRAAWTFAQAARTDLEKRNRLREYYDIYYERMLALASSPEMKAALTALKASHKSVANQPRVRHLTDGALPTPPPTPTPKQDKRKY
jgi:hypothetical protein